jgi:hypothetical protein
MDLPDLSITFLGPWQHKHSIPLDGRVLRLVAEHDFIIPPCDPNEKDGYVIPVRALEFSGDVTGAARQSHEWVTPHSLFTLSLADNNCVIVNGRGRISMCNLSSGSAMVNRGQVVAEWRPSTALCVITTASGEVMKQPVDSADMDVSDSASTSVSWYQLPTQVLLLLRIYAC